MSDDDDDLLSLDLGDGDIQLRNSQAEFKKPPIPATENFIADQNSDEIISTLAIKSNSTCTTTKNESSETVLMRQLFANDEDDEDELIASQMFIPSAHFKSQPVPAQKKQYTTKSLTPQKTVTLRSESNENTTAKTQPAVKARSNELAMLETLANHKSWTYAQSDVKNMFHSADIDASFANTYTLNNYYKKVNSMNIF